MITSAKEVLNNANSAADFIKSKIGATDFPEICIVLGSGLAPLASMCDISVEVPYSDIPYFPTSTVPGHEGRMLIGKLEGKNVVLMSGRFHYYEGYDTSVCTFYVRVLALLGVKTLFLTNAAGGILEGMKPAQLMAIEDHISFFCDSPLRGENIDEFGVRFPDQSSVYDREYISLLDECASELGIVLHHGVYAYTRGPQYETPAEIQILKTLGAGAVGMSTVPEAIVAVHSGIKVVGVSCVTNMAAGISKNALTHAEVIENANKSSNDSCSLVKKFISKL